MNTLPRLAIPPERPSFPTATFPGRTPAPNPAAIGPAHVLIILTSHNYARFVTTALDSVAAQTHPHWSCVIVDDNSHDNSVAVISQWLLNRNDPRFSLLTKRENEGQLAAIADALAGRPGAFVALLDADDIWYPTHLQTHLRAHLHHAGYAGLTCSDLTQIDATGAAITGTFRGTAFWGVPRRPRNVAFSLTKPGTTPPNHALDDTKATFIRPDLFRWHWTASSAMVFRRPLVELMLPDAMPKGRLCADHYLAHLCHFFTGSILLEATTAAYRRHGHNGFSSLPVYGSNAELARPDDRHHNPANLDTMLTHALDRQERLAACFGPHRARKLVSQLAGRQLRTTFRAGDKRVRALLGYPGMARALATEYGARLIPY